MDSLPPPQDLVEDEVALMIMRAVTTILTGIMGMESMAIFSLGTFLSINLRLVIPKEDLVDLHKVGSA